MPTSPPSRRRPKQARAEFALDSILEAAARTLEAHGKAGLTTQRVADTAGFSIGAIYQYFPNKEGLIEALARRELERLTAMMKEALTQPAPFGTGLNARRIIRVVAAFVGDRPRLYGILRAEWAEAAPDTPVGQGMRRYFELISGTLNRENPELGKRVGSDEARFVLFRAISGVLLATAQERPHYFGTDAFEDEMVRLILGFLNYDLSRDMPRLAREGDSFTSA
ncbi:TetR/AcrR family transcriptional regulator [Paraburkholderia sp. Tr-20389]|uniref:TetR/AcrR family transcriptional regulator n=1 Tax=Paraburkholderia sp. Tr-20389 TaxID=2703903 RepID=UPI00197DE0B3|nr:TetR/AcrR family transcriptional regulator [Paraburkholderia sp. Tr-20389]MBN3754670.1 TetR/AcrR family transcriptional regulator [Paraburkholderia sp. Tr-20389]